MCWLTPTLIRLHDYTKDIQDVNLHKAWKVFPRFYYEGVILMNKNKLALATVVSLTTAFNAVPLQVFAETNTEETFVEKGDGNIAGTPQTAPELVETPTDEVPQDEVPHEDTDVPSEALPEEENTEGMLEGKVSAVTTVNTPDVKEIVLGADVSFSKGTESYLVNLSEKVVKIIITNAKTIHLR